MFSNLDIVMEFSSKFGRNVATSLAVLIVSTSFKMSSLRNEASMVNLKEKLCFNYGFVCVFSFSFRRQ